jgi:hypothetical protein
MASCEFCSTCSFFNEESSDKPDTKELLKNEYCKSNFTKCARYKIALSHGMENVPVNISPDIFKGPKCFCGM